jgi:hypothetical protein
MPFDREIIEARLALDLISSNEMPKVAWDALEAGLDGPAIRWLAALENPTWFQVQEVLPRATQEMELTKVTVGEGAYRIARRRAQEILETGADPTKYTRELEYLCIRADWPDELSGYGGLDDEVYIARENGRPETEIREWLIQSLKELVARAPARGNSSS